MIELSSKCKNDTFLFHVDLQQKFNLNFWFNVFMLTVCKLWKYSECITAACPSEKKKKQFTVDVQLILDSVTVQSAWVFIVEQGFINPG